MFNDHTKATTENKNTATLEETNKSKLMHDGEDIQT